MTITLDENELKKLVNNALMGILDTLRMTKKEGNFESLPLWGVFRNLCQHLVVPKIVS